MSKKQQRQERQKRILEAEALVKAAAADLCPLATLPFAFAAFSKGGVAATISSLPAEEVSPQLRGWAFELCKANMQALYQQSSWKWSDQEKRAELWDPAARFLVALDADGAPLAYLHFRFLMEEEWPVAYCWELQVEPRARRCGLGQRLMQLLELMGARRQMQYAMLTVQTANEGAARFYERLGYSAAPHSPDPDDPDEAGMGHVILWKPLQRGLQQ